MNIKLIIDILLLVAKIAVIGIYIWGIFKIERQGRLLNEHREKIENLHWIKGLHYDDIQDLYQRWRELEKEVTALVDFVKNLPPTKK